MTNNFEGAEDKLKGSLNETAGKAKSAFGSATGDEKLQVEGKAQEAEGGLQKIVGDVKEHIADAVDAVKDAIHKPR